MRLSSSQRRWFFCATLCVLLVAVIAILIDLLLIQWRPMLDLKGADVGLPLSERSCETLTDTAGTIAITSILPAESPATLPMGHLLRRFEQTSRDRSGATLEITYVDPRTEPQFTAQMMAVGAEGTGVLIRQAGRSIFVPERALLSETTGNFDPANAEDALAAAFSRLSRADDIQIGWLTGHGEPLPTSTDPQEGYSGLFRALGNEGCFLREIKLDTHTSVATIPSEVKAIAIVNPRYPITPAERTLLSEWLDRGGRLICFLPTGDNTGLDPLLEKWGVRVGITPRLGTSTATSGLSYATHLDQLHPITRDLAGQTSVVFCAPKALYPCDTRGISITALVKLPVEALPNSTTSSSEEMINVLLAAERGSIVGDDLGFRPGRIIVFGDATFASNRNILNRASANRDLTINAFQWLTGLSGSSSRGASYGIMIGNNKQTWLKTLLITGLVIPLVFCLLLKLISWRLV